MNQNNSSDVESDVKGAGEDAAEGKASAADRWAKLIEQQRDSGLSVSAYCRERGVSAASFFAWRRRLSRDPVAPGFRPVKVAPETSRASERSESAIELCLRGGRRLRVRRGFDPALLVEVVRAMEAIA